jgi:hypothetical protein
LNCADKAVRKEFLCRVLAISRFGGRALAGELLDPRAKRRAGSFRQLQGSGLTSRKLAASTLEHECRPTVAPLGSAFEPARLLLDSTTFCGVHSCRSCGLGYGHERNTIHPRHYRAWGKVPRCPASQRSQHAQSVASHNPEGKLRHPAITKARLPSPIAK